MAEVTYRKVENAPYSDGVKDNGGALKTSVVKDFAYPYPYSGISRFRLSLSLIPAYPCVAYPNFIKHISLPKRKKNDQLRVKKQKYYNTNMIFLCNVLCNFLCNMIFFMQFLTIF